MEPYIITFLGNRKVSDRKSAMDKIVSQLESFIWDGEYMRHSHLVFFCDGYGEFAHVASEAIDVFRKRHPAYKAEKLFVTPFITPDYAKTNKYMREFYDDIVYPPLENVPPRLAIVRRNEWMVARCDMLIAYMENPCGSTRKCVEYAFRKNKSVVFVDSGEITKRLNQCYESNRKSC